MSGKWMTSRKIIQRVLIEGTLILETPAHFGNGDAEGLTDIPLLRDPLEGKPLLTGASIAGALRNYLREVELGYGKAEKRDGATRVEALFGHLDEEKKASVQSFLIVDDALGSDAGIELRDGVAIEPETRTAAEGKKFDLELLVAGTRFDLSLELLVPNDKPNLLGDLAIALRGLEQGKIGLGQRKRRGYGECTVADWRVRRYWVNTPEGLIAWLNDDKTNQQIGTQISQLVQSSELHDARSMMSLDITLGLDGSLLIRSGSGIGNMADLVHLRSSRAGGSRPVPILSGTSLAGAIRARAGRIAKTVLPAEKVVELIDGMFGKRIQSSDDVPSGSRVIVNEAVIEKFLEPELVQSRVKIDRFTGGTYPQALFSEQPVFGDQDTRIKVTLSLRNPKPAEVGLLLLVLKDLWTGDLPLGGESSVGRGRMSGMNAVLKYLEKDWTFTQNGEAVSISGTGTAEELETFVRALKEPK